MKNYLDKSYRIEEGMEKNANLVFIVMNLISILLFIAGGFAFFEFLYILCNLIGAVVSGAPYEMLHELSRMFPTMLTLGMVVHLGFFAHVITRAHSKEERGKLLFGNSIAFIAMGAIAFVYFIVGFFTNSYSSLVEGYPTLLYPLDNMLLALLLVGLGVLGILKKEWILGKLNLLPVRENDTRLKVTRVFDSIFGGIAYCCALFASAAMLYGIVVIDRAHGHGFYIFGLYLIFLATVDMFAQFKLMYCPLKEDSKKEYLFKAALITLLGNIVCYAIYFLALTLDPEAAGQAAYGILPIEYTASVNVVTLLYPIVLIVTPLTAMIKAKIHKNK